MKPLKVEGKAEADLPWQSPRASALLTKAKKLRFGGGETWLSAAERDTADWLAEKDDFLEALADWEPEDEKTEGAYFHQKCVLFKSVIGLIPRPAEREAAVRRFVEFLNEFDLDRGSRIEWFWQAEFLLRDTPV